MRSPFSGKFGLAFIGAMLGVTAGTFAAAPNAPAQGTPPDGVPPNLVAFFTGDDGCPSGWADATHLAGYVVFGAAQPSRVGEASGTPLGDREDRTHTHSYDVSFTLGQDNVAGANSCCNNSAAAPASPHETFDTEPSTSGVPFVQYRACVKQ